MVLFVFRILEKIFKNHFPQLHNSRSETGSQTYGPM